MRNRLIILTTAILLSLPVASLAAEEACLNDKPKRCLVLDMDNKTLIYNADVAFSDGRITHTDAHGYFALPDTFSYVIIAKNGYIRQKVEHQLLGDTLFLVNASHCLPEVTVMAMRQPKNINGRFRINPTDMALIGQGQQLNQGFSLPIGLLIYPLVKLFSKKPKVNMSRKILENY